jgi:benzoyl-CoA reductase subunit C
LEGFRELVDRHHKYAAGWKEKTGRRVLGYFCTYVPEEIIYAAGILPVRVIGSHESKTKTESHIANMYCSFCRDCLAQGLQGKYSYLDGIIKARSCQHMRQAFASWQLHVPIEYSYYISMPALVRSAPARHYLIEELRLFKKSLEEWTGNVISDEALRKSIDIYNLNRRLLSQIYELRKDDAPPFSGADALEMVISGQITDKEEHNALLSEVLNELPGVSTRARNGPRVMLIGSENDDLDYVRFVESLGCTIVADETCTGSRYFKGECRAGDDPLEAIAARYLERPPCPAKDIPGHQRLPYILQLIKEYRVEGVIVTHQEFCQNHETALPELESLLRDQDIPVLVLEYAFNAPTEWVRTRVEAFLEIVQSVSI